MSRSKYTKVGEDDRVRPPLTKVLLLLLLFIGFNIGLYTQLWHKTSARLAAQSKITQAEIDEIGDSDVASKGWITDYIDAKAVPKSALDNNGTLNKWVNDKVASVIKDTKATTIQEPVTNLFSTASPINPSYFPGTGIVMNGLQISSSLGSVIDSGEIASHAVRLDNLAGSGCSTGQTLKFDGANWICANDESANMPIVSGVANRLTLFSSTSGLTSSYLYQDSGGLWIDGGKDLYIGGVAHGNGSGLYNLNGAQLAVGSVPGSALQDGSIQSNDLDNAAVTSGKLADGAVTAGKLASNSVTLGKLSQSGCTSGQIIKWNGLSWACAADNDEDSTYAAGTGLELNNGTFSLDSSSANTWSGLQSFGGGISLGGHDYLDLAGSGLSVSGGVLSSVLGSSIDTSELADGAVTSDKLASGVITLDKLGQNGCTNMQVIKWNGIEWICADDESNTYSAGAGLLLASGAFSLDASQANTWVASQVFSGGINVGGNNYLDLAGAGLTFSGGILNTVLGSTVGTSELENGSVTSSKLAAGSVSLDKLGQNGCSNGQVIKWSTSSWACASDDNQNTVYLAGAGISLNANTFSLDASNSNTWTGTQSFDGGIIINGNTYTNLAGTGLVFNNGTLSSSLGTLIDSSEIDDNAVINSKIANGTIALSKLGQNGCSLDQVIKWNGTGWVCADVDTTTGGSSTITPYSAGFGLTLNGTEFGLDTSHANSWTGTQTFSNGVSLGGNTYTNLAGTGLVFSGGVLNASLGTSVSSSEIDDGAITSDKLAPGVVTLDKLAQDGCSVNQIITWTGVAWECVNKTDNDTTYTAGAGLVLSSGAFALDTTHSNNWSGSQTFANGITVGGHNYTNLAGTGLEFNNGALNVSLGSSISSDEIEDNAVTSAKIADGTITTSDLGTGVVTAAKLAQNGCSNGNVLKWQTSAWVCASDVDTDTNTTYVAGTGLSLDSGTGTFSLDTSHANTWTGTQLFSNGVGIGGNTYTNLAGTGLSFSSGTLSTTLGTSIDTGEISDGAITSAKLASGSVTFDKLGSNSCTSQQTIKWSGTAWVCANDVDTNTTYTAGSGLSLNSGAFSIDTTAANNWSSNQTFAGGLTIGGNTYTSLAGTGLLFSNGALTSSLGTSIDTGEINDGAVTFAKLDHTGCSGSQVLKWNGTAWACAADTDTTYSAGTGLTLSSNTFNLDLTRANNWSGLQTFSNGFSVGGSTYTNLAGTGLSLASGTLSTSLGTSIETGEITDGAVTSAKILDGTVISADLADGAVTSAKILDGTITGADLASGTITASSIADGTITATKQSTAARKRIVAVSIPPISASLLSSQEQAIFVAPTNGTITKVTFTSGNTIVALATQGTISVERKTATAGTVASISLASIGMTALNPVAPTLGSGLTFSTGDLYTFKYNPGIVGVGLNNMLITIEYLASE